MGGAGKENEEVTDIWSTLHSSYGGGSISAGRVLEYVMSSIESRTGYLRGCVQLSKHQFITMA